MESPFPIQNETETEASHLENSEMTLIQFDMDQISTDDIRSQDTEASAEEVRSAE